MNKSATRALIPLGIFIALAALLFYGLGLNPREIPSPLIGKPAPDFALASLKDPGRTLTRKDLLGKVSLVNVWASWCPSCRQEHAELMRIARANADIQVIGFNWKDTRPEALQMLQRFGDPYAEILYDPDNEVGIDWGVYGAPETFVVDGEGIIRHKRIGPIDQQVWESEILPVIERYSAKKS
ncbi:DsbE family thiol:disulfide interchange protein [Imhoffiella purpurea]|uniref:Cytochrome c-type biogenesis protein CcmG/DsbE, thiol:disulfide oxidoreductase n=1 Tax=Imhoffiella purpurea TaxID=1249627 RepID=W9VAE5_9GAMM|nr:DsbE family thiol:disulfide interchange protein [Imhoffiella purpurea]EXJ16588.1 Cytochrome c-type biogenesis protein CcmG/DsbE, thiol:disulfide oxidoreductase [Imhoffiella purpurea]